jgi:methyltransferase-like protein
MSQPSVSYDEFPYPRLVFPRTHPKHLGALARLMALDAAPAERCRVLELGCAGGANLLPMAYALPASEFVGVDLSLQQIAEAQRVARDVRLQNVTFRAADLTTLGAELGRFDYVIAHGLYSWVPAAVRDKLLALCGELLAPNGVAYISYKTYPGGHVADLVRQMGLYHNQAAAPGDWPRRMGELFQLLRSGIPATRTAYRASVLDHMKRLLDEHPGSLLHDDLEADSEPVYFHQFAAHADLHGLQYLGEAEFPAMCGAGIAPEALDRIRAADNLLELEQYLDFLYGRSFRSTLLCHKSIALDRTLQPERIFDLLVVPEVQFETSKGSPDEPGRAASGAQRFRTAYGVLEVTDVGSKLALTQLARNASRAMPLPELLAAIQDDARQLPAENATVNIDLRQLAQRVLDWYATGVVELSTWAPAFNSQITARPVASELARYEASRGWDVSSLMHRRIQLADPLARQVLQLLDGRHDREQLVEELLSSEQSTEIGSRRNQGRTAAQSEIAAALRRKVDHCLQDFARQSLLVG